jgi:hypothetical protein
MEEGKEKRGERKRREKDERIDRNGNKNSRDRRKIKEKNT